MQQSKPQLQHIEMSAELPYLASHRQFPQRLRNLRALGQLRELKLHKVSPRKSEGLKKREFSCLTNRMLRTTVTSLPKVGPFLPGRRLLSLPRT